MAKPVEPELRERFMTRLLDAWPERDVPEETLRSALKLTIETDEHGQMLVAELLGYRISVDVVDDCELPSLVEQVAGLIAYDAEGDRWTNGDAWREYRSSLPCSESGGSSRIDSEAVADQGTE